MMNDFSNSLGPNVYNVFESIESDLRSSMFMLNERLYFRFTREGSGRGRNTIKTKID